MDPTHFCPQDVSREGREQERAMSKYWLSKAYHKKMIKISYSCTNKVIKDCVAENAHHTSEIYTLFLYNPGCHFSL